MNGAEKMTIFRMVVMVPSELFIEAENLEQAAKAIKFVASKYDKLAFPIYLNQPERTGIAEVKVLSIEKAREGDDIRPTNFIIAPPETPTEPPQGPKLA